MVAGSHGQGFSDRGYPLALHAPIADELIARVIPELHLQTSQSSRAASPLRLINLHVVDWGTATVVA
jgi:hypothetical protein